MLSNILRRPLLAASAVLAAITAVAALGTACTAPLGSGNAAAGAPYWMETIAHQGIAPFSSNPSSYTVFRNVKSFGRCEFHLRNTAIDVIM
jgi:glucan 1,3-beta-glucosidase